MRGDPSLTRSQSKAPFSNHGLDCARFDCDSRSALRLFAGLQRCYLFRKLHRSTSGMAPGNSLCQVIRLDLRQPKDKREEALPRKLSRSQPAEARNKEGWNYRACGWAYISQVNRSLAHRERGERESHSGDLEASSRWHYVGSLRQGCHADEAAGPAEDRQPTSRRIETQL